MEREEREEKAIGDTSNVFISTACVHVLLLTFERTKSTKP